MSGESTPIFLDLLHMTYVEIERGELCTVGVQTNLEKYMPNNIQMAVDDETRSALIVAESRPFIRGLDELRAELQQLEQSKMAIRKLKGLMTERMDAMRETELQMARSAVDGQASGLDQADEHRGDHHIPRVGQDRVDHFVTGAKLKKIFEQK